MINKEIKDIDINYFEEIQRDSNRLTEELNLKLREKIINDFKSLICQKFNEPTFKNEFLSNIQNQLSSDAAKENAADILACLKQQLKEYAKERLLFVSCPDITLTELEKMYTDDNKISWIELLTKGNKEDILEFYQALMNRTAWDCKEMLEQSTSDFLSHLIA